jgi:predicted adenine nucleotide alpha hydrolase (AANH) superfamily ATPase
LKNLIKVFLNYNYPLLKVILSKEVKMVKDKILVHICCGVDAVWALRKIKEEFPDSHIEGYFYDPNIHPQSEYELRWIETKRVCDSLEIPCKKGEYDIENWFLAVKGYENEPERGERCSICHDIRLEKSAKYAKEKGFSKFTTVLMMSPKKDFNVLKQIGEKIGEKYGLEFLSIEFRKDGGIEKMNKLSKQMQLYHQNYCGCIYGLFKQREGLDYIPELVSFSKKVLPASTEEKLIIKKLRTLAEENGIYCEEEEFFFINWRVINSIVKIGKQEIYHEVLPYSASIRGILRDKVKTIIKENGKTVLKFYKSPVEVWIVENTASVKLKTPRFISNPVFIIENKEIKKDQKFEFKLQTQIDHNAKTSILYIGNKEGRHIEDFTVNKDLKKLESYILNLSHIFKEGYVRVLPSDEFGLLVIS